MIVFKSDALRSGAYLAVLLFVFACGPGDTLAGEPDADGDGISDEHEGYPDLDSDEDGIPNYLDTDSDNDGIPDIKEARADGEKNLSGNPPVDSDADKMPDYADTDSDNNRLLDSAEQPGDSDGDGLPDRVDTDDDNDRLSDEIEIAGVFSPLIDSDGDGAPNYLDPDSDNDGILDGDEFNEDTDGDGLFNWEDPDSDEDGILDRDEVDDRDPRTPPPDTDGDLIPDFLDRDSDNDGLSDRFENDNGINPYVADSDDDGVTDLIEVAAGTDVYSKDDSPRTRGDFVFTIPYQEPATPRKDTLNFRTSIQYADMYILIDESGSMSSEMSSIKKALTNAVDILTCDDYGVACFGTANCDPGQFCGTGGTCIQNPRTSGCIESFYTGYGLYDDSFSHFVELQPDPSVTVASLPTKASGGTSERVYAALSCIADRTQCEDKLICEPEGKSCVGYREDAIRIVVNVTDEGDACSESSAGRMTCPPKEDRAVEALLNGKVTYVGVNSNSSIDSGADIRTQELMNALTERTNSVNGDGDPLWFRGADEMASDAIVEAIQDVVKNVPLRVSIELKETQDDPGNILHLIDRVEVNNSGDNDCTALPNVEDSDGDSIKDTFGGVVPGTPVCWDVSIFDNETIPPSDEPLVYRLRMIVRGNDAIIDERTAYFLIPPKVEEIFVPR